MRRAGGILSRPFGSCGVVGRRRSSTEFARPCLTLTFSSALGLGALPLAQLEGHELGEASPVDLAGDLNAYEVIAKAHGEEFGKRQDQLNLVLQQTVHYAKKIATYTKALSEMPDQQSLEAQRFKLIIHMLHVERGKVCEKALATQLAVPVTNQNPTPLRRLLSADAEMLARVKYVSEAKQSCKQLLANMPEKPVFTLPAATYAAYASASATAKNVKKTKEAAHAQAQADAAEGAKQLQRSYESAAALESAEEKVDQQQATSYSSSAARVAE